MNKDEKNILGIYKNFHPGKKMAITRNDFFKEYWKNLPELSDRQFRNIYSKLPIVTCEKGGYYPIRKEEILEYRDYLRKKAIPLFERFRRVCEAHPQLADDAVQLELF